MKPTLLILDDWEKRIAASPSWNQLKELVDIEFLTEPIHTVSDALLSNVSFLMAIRERTALNEQVFARLPKLKLVLQTGGHAYHIDMEAAKKHGIAIALGRGGKAPLAAVTELTIAMMLGVIHLLPQAQHSISKGRWPLLNGRTLNGRRLGILGMGRYGTRVANIAKNSFNMDVVAWARPGSDIHNPNDVPRMPLDELLQSSDVVSIHLRLSPESTDLLNSQRLQTMKPGSILINTARGAIVNESALINALVHGPLGGAGLDVFTYEPLAPDSRLRSLDNVILTPHIGWTVEEVFEEFAQIASAQLLQYLNNSLSGSELILSAGQSQK
jgi:phosphoglycerate dehydrogenase-like enzyme